MAFDAKVVVSPTAVNRWEMPEGGKGRQDLSPEEMFQYPQTVRVHSFNPAPMKTEQIIECENDKSLAADVYYKSDASTILTLSPDLDLLSQYFDTVANKIKKSINKQEQEADKLGRREFVALQRFVYENKIIVFVPYMAVQILNDAVNQNTPFYGRTIDCTRSAQCHITDAFNQRQDGLRHPIQEKRDQAACEFVQAVAQEGIFVGSNLGGLKHFG